jgi:hypothetical protein
MVLIIKWIYFYYLINVSSYDQFFPIEKGNNIKK